MMTYLVTSSLLSGPDELLVLALCMIKPDLQQQVFATQGSKKTTLMIATIQFMRLTSFFLHARPTSVDWSYSGSSDPSGGSL